MHFPNILVWQRKWKRRQLSRLSDLRMSPQD